MSYLVTTKPDGTVTVDDLGKAKTKDPVDVWAKLGEVHVDADTKVVKAYTCAEDEDAARMQAADRVAELKVRKVI